MKPAVMITRIIFCLSGFTMSAARLPEIKLAPEDLKVIDNGMASFYCEVSGSSELELYWRKSGRRISISRPRYLIMAAGNRGTVLRIDPVKSQKDDGLFECYADDRNGEFASAKARLEVYSSLQEASPGYPRIIEGPTMRSAQKDQNVVMHCSAVGIPAPTIRWIKNFLPLSGRDARLRILENGSLEILKVSESDEGKYECTAKNSVGFTSSASAHLYVQVRRLLPEFSIPPENAEVMSGGDVNLTCVAIGSPMPFVKWRLGTVDLTSEGNVPIGKNVLQLIGVNKSATYTCVASSDLGSKEANVEVRVKALPKPPVHLTASSVTSDSVRLQWRNENSEPVESYVVHYKRKEIIGEAAKEMVDVLTTDYVLMSLSPNTLYHIQLMAVNNVGRSSPGNLVEVQTKEAAPGTPPRNVRARPVNMDSILVQWDEPELANGLVKGYKVYFTTSPKLPITSWTLLTVDSSEYVTVKNLQINLPYTVTVLAFTGAGEGPLSDPVAAEIRQEGEALEPPRNVAGNSVSSTSIQLTWDEPETSGETIDSYEIYCNVSETEESIHISVSPPKGSFLLEDLSPNTKYIIRVASKSARGEGERSSPITIYTMEAAPNGSPQTVKAEYIDSTSITVTWSAPLVSRQNGQILGYRVLFSETKGLLSSGDPWSSTAAVPASEMTFTARGLRKWTFYNVQVLAYTAKGDGPLSDAVFVQTAEDVPGEPRKVKLEAINSTAIGIQWRPPLEKEQNGIIRGYQIYYTRLDDSDEEEPAGLTQMQDVNDGKLTEAVLSMLQPDTEYQVQLAAYTRKGDGERSRPRKVRTKEPVLGSPRGLQLALVQEDPPVVQVTWQAPPPDAPHVLGYKLEYGPKNGSFEELVTEANVYKFTTTFLEHGVEYEFRLSAKTAANYGVPVFQRFLTPDGTPAGSPLNVSMASATATGIRLQWNPPATHHQNGEIILYEVMYHQESNYVDDWTTNTTETSTIIEGLVPGAGYLFQTRAYTSRGPGPWSSPLEIVTLGKDAISPPEDISLERLSPTLLRVTWDASVTPDVVEYQVFYSTLATPDMDKWQSVNSGPHRTVELQDLKAQSVYAVRIRSKLKDGRIGDFSKTVMDKSVLNDIVQNLIVKRTSENSILLQWSAPKKGEVSLYKIEYRGTKRYRDSDGREQQTESDGHESVPGAVPGNENVAYIDNLEPYTLYKISISAEFLDGSLGASNTIQTRTEVDAPPEIQAPLFRKFTSESSMMMQLYPASEINGPITHYCIIVVPSEETEGQAPNSFSVNELLKTPDHSTDSAWIAGEFDVLPKLFGIGDGSRGGTTRLYNKPLTQGQAYRIFVRGYASENKYTSSFYSESILMDANPEVVAYESGPAGIELLYFVAPVCISIVLILLIVLMIVLIRRRSCKKGERSIRPTKVLLTPEDVASQNHDPIELHRLNFQTPGMVSHPPISVDHLSEVIECLKSNDGEGFSREFESIDPGEQFTWDVSSREVNKGKNRYANVITYDQSRVILQSLDDVPGSDYINANYMDGYCRHNAYIATQGPLPDTFGDFWRMVWEQQCKTVVMMTRLEERTRVKCDQYWPNRGTELYGVIQVTITDVLELASFTLRTFQISSTESVEKREVRHLQFTAWPDHGIPDHPSSLLNFIRRVKAVNPPDSGPIVVHCSAGVGRTGVFIVIDAMLERIQHEKTLDVYGHVTCLRAQRNYTVQTEDQYVFIYDALLEAVESGNTEVPANNLLGHVQSLTRLEPGEVISEMELEFLKLNDMRMSLSFTSANLPANRYKNRLVNFLPYESTRVCLQPIRGVEGSDYINASFIDGYRFRRAFIATQGPLSETTDDFWRMIWEHNCTIIVMMTRLKELNRDMCHQYWPEERSARYQYFVVDPVAQYNMPLYILREFKVTDARDGQFRIVRQFHFIDWPEQGVPGSGEGFIEFIGHVQKTKEQFGQDGPIIVHCSAGVGRTGVFIALSIILERMRYEGLVDLFQTVRILRTQRIAMVQNEDQYSFCYRAALEYLGSFDHYTS